MDPRFIYTGPSWAASSYPINQDSTSLAKEWGIPYINASEFGSSIVKNLKSIKAILKNKSLPVVWICNSTLLDITESTDMSIEQTIQSTEWKDLFKKCDNYCFEQINSLGVPVLLIGGHQDIKDCEYENITIGHDSWQKWLAEQSGMTIQNNIVQVDPADGGSYSLEYCWGAEIVHRVIHENPSIKPDPNLLNSVWDIYYFWEELQRRDWFFEVHPNKRGNVEFAKFLKPVVEKFLEENKNG